MSFGDLEGGGGGGGGRRQRPAGDFDLLGLGPSSTPAAAIAGAASNRLSSSASSVASSIITASADDSRRVWDRASHAVFLISNNVASLQKFVAQLGSAKDTAEMRQRLHSLTEDTRNMIKQTSIDLKQLGGLLGSSPFEERQRKIAQQKLQKDFEDVLGRFQSVSRLAAEKSREVVLKARIQQQQHQLQEDDDHGANESQALLGPSTGQRLQQLHVLDNEVEYNEALIQEREEDLRSIERSIVEVNEIFRDLGTLVHEQQYMLDNIESNVGEVAINVESATGELRTAANYQRLSQNRMCCLFIILAVVGTVVLV
ncbi:hypothetical protein HK405_009440, partial [Cladochytrium tenue]